MKTLLVKINFRLGLTHYLPNVLGWEITGLSKMAALQATL